jgi:colanic acid biosynthesis protein WcaH
MADKQKPIPPEKYRVIAQNVPIVSVDLLVHLDEGLLLGKRTNAPAEEAWFVPGGTVLKGETLEQAVHRVAMKELGTGVTIQQRLGTYEHFYDSAETPGVESKHYLATAYIVTPLEEELSTDNQHERFQTFTAPFPDFHDYVERYVEELRTEGYEY